MSYMHQIICNVKYASYQETKRKTESGANFCKTTSGLITDDDDNVQHWHWNTNAKPVLESKSGVIEYI